LRAPGHKRIVDQSVGNSSPPVEEKGAVIERKHFARSRVRPRR
jgi:hypothetical protein